MGTSRSLTSHTLSIQDHPHAYGDKQNSRLARGFVRGSSPRVWGQVGIASMCERTDRIIPTRMGTSYQSYYKHPLSGDHPHAYGDKELHHDVVGIDIGSSPRVWGQAFIRKLFALIGRIIPTRMGTRLTRMSNSMRRRDHPHAYGDKCLN